MTITLPLQAAESPFTVDSWTTEDGLPQSSVISIVQTHDGYLWLATLNGLVRFDGNSFTPFNVNNTPGLPSDRIVYLFEDSGDSSGSARIMPDCVPLKMAWCKNFNTGGRRQGSSMPAKMKPVRSGSAPLTEVLFCWKDGQFELTSIECSRPDFAELFYRAMHVLVPGRRETFGNCEEVSVEKLHGNKLEKILARFPGQFMVRSLSTAAIFGGLGLMPISLPTCEDNNGNLVVGTEVLAFIGSMRRAVTSTFQPAKACLQIRAFTLFRPRRQSLGRHGWRRA